MNVNKEFFNAIKPALVKLQEIIKGEFVIFGSAPLYLIGVVEFKGVENFNDIDVAVKDKSLIPKEAEIVTFHGDPNRPFYKMKIDNFDIDFGTGWPDEKGFFPKLFIDPIEVEGFRFVNLDTIEEWKKYMVEKFDREKDKKYLKLIEKYRLTNNKN